MNSTFQLGRYFDRNIPILFRNSNIVKSLRILKPVKISWPNLNQKLLFFIPAIWNMGILLHKQATHAKHFVTSVIFGQIFRTPTTVFKFFFSRGGIIIKFSVWIFVVKCFFGRWKTIFKGIGRFQASKENQAFGSCFWKLYVLKLDPYYFTQVAWVNL